MPSAWTGFHIRLDTSRELFLESVSISNNETESLYGLRSRAQQWNQDIPTYLIILSHNLIYSYAHISALNSSVDSHTSLSLIRKLGHNVHLFLVYFSEPTTYWALISLCLISFCEKAILNQKFQFALTKCAINLWVFPFNLRIVLPRSNFVWLDLFFFTT